VSDHVTDQLVGRSKPPSAEMDDEPADLFKPAFLTAQLTALIDSDLPQ